VLEQKHRERNTDTYKKGQAYVSCELQQFKLPWYDTFRFHFSVLKTLAII